jgi:retinol dehydrogenase-12
MNFQPDGTPEIIPSKDFMTNYMQSKVGDAWLAAHFAEKLGKHGIMSVVSRYLQY